MNNGQMYERELAGGVPYPETEKYAYDRWYTTTGLTDGSEYKTIRFNIRQDNLLLHLTNGYLEIHGQLRQKTSDAVMPSGAKIAMIHNAIPHLFDNVKLTVGNQLVENVNQPGHVSSMMFNVLFPKSKAENDGIQFVWCPDTDKSAETETNKGFSARQNYIIDQPATRGTFKLRAPLFLFYGFTENFLALKGYNLEFEMVRGPDYPALFRADNGVPEGKFKFKEILLNLPVVDPSNTVLLESLKGLKNPEPYLYSFRQRHGMFATISKDVYDFQMTFTTGNFAERPQMVFIAFQRNQTKDQKFNHALYSNEDVETMYIKLNNERYPSTLIKADWTQNDNGFFYEMQKHCRENYLQYPSRYTEGNMLNPNNYRDLYTIYCFDVTKGDYTLGGNSIVSSLHIHFRTKTQENLVVYVSWYNDRTIEFFTDGSPPHLKTQTDSYK